MTADSFRETAQRIRRTVFDTLAWRMSRPVLHRYFGATDADSIVRATSEYSGRGFYEHIKAMQDDREFTALVRRIIDAQPRVIVEIGTRSGGTLFAWVRASRAAELVISIDLPDGRFGGGYDRRRGKLYREFAADRPHTKMVMLRADSHAPETLRAAREALGGRPIDFLFIDGDHTYAGVKNDFEQYGALVAPGGMIAFHDIRTTGREREVSALWQELKTHHDCEEIAFKPDHLGIGIVRKGR